MTALLAANPKAKDRALARKAIAQLGPSPLAEGTLRKIFGSLRKDGLLPPLETEEDIEERRIKDFFKARDAERERNKIQLAIKLDEALAMGLDLGALSLEAVEERALDLRRLVSHLEVSVGSGSFVEGASSADEAIAKLRAWRELLSEARKKLSVVQEVAGCRHRLNLT
jgi:hypothetical protein